MARESGGALVIDTTSRAIRCPTSAAWRRPSGCWRRRARCRPSERALLLLSGGASALVGAPVDGLTLDELRAATRALLDGGASIHEINVVRRHLTRLGGGKLAAACAGAIDVLALSDVAGDDPATIGSGPASPEPATRAEALALAQALRAARGGASGARARRRESARRRRGVRARHLSRAGVAGDAARRGGARDGGGGLARDGAAALVDGDVEEVAGGPRARARGALERGAALVAVGEPTVRVRGAAGGGGRAQHLALVDGGGAARRRACAFVALGSDGRDGPTEAAGAAVDGGTLRRAARRAASTSPARWRASTRIARSPRVGATVARFDSGTNLTDLYILTCGDADAVVFARRVDHLDDLERAAVDREALRRARPRARRGSTRRCCWRTCSARIASTSTRTSISRSRPRSWRRTARSSSGGSAASRWPTSSARRSSARSS